MTIHRVLVLGGYGNFGKRILERMSDLEGITLLVAGRDLEKSRVLCTRLSVSSRASLEAVAIDILAPGFADRLRALSPDLVIHTGGPFQGQDYRVAQACLSVPSHYIDLADDRRFVCDISALNDRALERQLLLVSGASSVPGLSSVVIDSLVDHFSSLDTIDFAIAPGNRAERGEATVRGILSYTGRPFRVLDRGEWVDRYGWMSPRKLGFGDRIGDRWLANVDIPDLELFPQRYPSVHTVNFQAGLELPLLHLGMVFMALLCKIGLVANWSTFTRPIVSCSEMFSGLGTDIGGMQIRLRGLDPDGNPRLVRWLLCAEDGVGPNIPTLSTIILARKLIAGGVTARGAMPCLGMYSLGEFDEEASSLGIYHRVEVDHG